MYTKKQNGTFGYWLTLPTVKKDAYEVQACIYCKYGIVDEYFGGVFVFRRENGTTFDVPDSRFDVHGYYQEVSRRHVSDAYAYALETGNLTDYVPPPFE